MDTSNSVAHYFSLLEPDDWRKNVGFSPEIESANTCLFQTRSDAEAAAVLGRWLEKWQPCLFGRIAAKSDALTYCFLTENDLRESDEFISTKIQSKRLEWTRHGFEGRKSGFILLAISPMLVSAVPSPAMLELARRLCFLYLETDIFTDKIHLDQLYLQKPGSALTTWKWLGGAFEDYPEPKVDSLGKALELAMRTIDMAADAVSGKATELLPSPIGRTECPVKLSNKVRDKNCYEYKGFYHTDYTLPSEYFSPDIARPAHITPHVLDFTYLFKRDVDNPDFRLLGEGHQIRDLTNENSLEHANTEDLQMKAAKGEPHEVLIDENERLRVALKMT